MLKETTDVVVCCAGFANAVGKSLADGKITVFDALNFLEPLKLAPEAFKGADKVVAECKAATDADKEALGEVFKAKFDIPEDAVEAAVEAAVDFVISAWEQLSKLVLHHEPKAKG